MMTRIAAVGVLVGTVLVAGCGESDGAQAQPSQSGTAPERTVNVEVTEVRAEPFTHFVQVVGTVEAQRDVMVSAEEGGVVESIQAAKGASVRPGAPLVRLDADVLRAQSDQAESQAALAEESWQRQKQLWEQDSIGTEIAYLQARYNARTAQAQARVLQERLERTVVRAPIAGILDARPVEIGNMVAPGAPVARILDVDTVEIVAGVPERYAEDVRRGTPAAVHVKALNGREFAGTVDFVGAAIDAGNRTFQVEILVPNPGLGIKPGMVADVRIARGTLEGALVVPRHAVMRRENGYVVFVARRTDTGWRAETRAVEPGPGRDDLMVILSGLEPGDRVVTVGQHQLADGDAIRINNEIEMAGERTGAGAEEVGR